MTAVNEWKRKVSDAINEFSEAKAREDELFCILKNAASNPDYRRLSAIGKQWGQLRQAAQEKNEIVLFLLRNAPESAISISDFAARDTIV